MNTAYSATDGGGTIATNLIGGAIPSDVVWIDSLSPSDDDLAWLGDAMGFELPNRHDMTEIELSSRLYKEGDAHVMIANLLPKSATEILTPRPAAFVMKKGVLLTIRYCDFYSFERVSGVIVKQDEKRTPQSIFCLLMDEAVSDRADDLEFSMRRMEELTGRLFKQMPKMVDDTVPSDPKLEQAIQRIGVMGERVANIRESIASLQRVLNYARTYLPESWLGDQAAIIDSLRADLTALSDEAAFFMNKLSFNLDATLGMINIEETKIIRLLSIVTLLLSPPTLIAGIYGMNFHIMPELEWPFGYIFALALMFGTAIASVWFLKRKHWM